MTQKRKIHDPMKTQTENISHSWGYEKITRKEKHTKRMALLVEQTQQLLQKMFQEQRITSDKYKDSLGKAEPKEIQKKYNEELRTSLDKFNQGAKTLLAESDAIFLIANNIARRGQPLHPDTAEKKLQKMRGSAKAIIIKYTIANGAVANLSKSRTVEHDLCYFLRKNYGVTIMNVAAYKYCQDMISKYREMGDAGQQKLQHYENFAKKFHKSVINATQENQK